MVLDEAAADYGHPRVDAVYRNLVDQSQVTEDVTKRPGWRKEWKNNMSPRLPSVSAGLSTGMLFL